MDKLFGHSCRDAAYPLWFRYSPDIDRMVVVLAA